VIIPPRYNNHNNPVSLGPFAKCKLANSNLRNQVCLMDEFAQMGELAFVWLGKMRGKHALGCWLGLVRLAINALLVRVC